MVASAGGHLAELYALRERWVPPGTPLLWLTFDTPQSRELLADEDVVWFPEIPPRGVSEVLRSVPLAQRTLRKRKVTRVVSTGSGIALAVMPIARALRVPCDFIDSVACLDRPSQTGRILSRVPGIVCYSQTTAWTPRRWQSIASVLDAFTPEPREPIAVERLVITLGTIKPYPFSRLLDRVAEIVPDEVDLFVQHGSTPVPPSLRQRPRSRFAALVPPSEMIRLAGEPATAVVSHAGAGSALSLLEIGVSPVVVPREATYGEHVDDHQQAIAGYLDRRGLVTRSDVESLTWDHVLRSVTVQVTHHEPSGGSTDDTAAPEVTGAT